MAKKAPQRTAIVGRNVSAALIALELAEKSDNVVSWFQTQKDRILHCPAAARMTVATSLLPKSVALNGEVIDDPIIFLPNLTKIRCSDLLDPQRCLNLKTWPKLYGAHPTVAAKIVCAALWNDLSPDLWHRDSRGIPHTPKYDWPMQTPIARRHFPKAQLVRFRREALLETLAAKVFEKNVSIRMGQTSVLGVETARGPEFQLIHNSPHGFSSVDRVVWTSFASTFKEEGAPYLKTTPRKASVRWKSFGCYVPRSHVTALPEFSVWLPSILGERFMETGEVTSGCLKRVHCAWSPDRPELAWLQIEEIELRPQPLSQSMRRPDSFLWKACPYLSGETLEFEPLFFEEQNFFLTPEPQLTRLFPRIHTWFPGAWGDPVQTCRDLLKS